MKRLFILVGMLMAWPTLAQQPQLDPRLAMPTVTALQSLVALKEAQLAVLQERIADLEKQCGDICKPKPPEDKK